MIQAILFDLDNTLLLNDNFTFMQGYLSLLRQHVPPQHEVESFVRGVLHCTQVMMANEDTAVSNRNIFWQAFSQRVQGDAATLEAHFDQFYEEQFPHLQSLTTTYPQTAELIQHCFQANLQVVIATNPVYPRRAIEHRLAWAGVPITHYPYAFITDYKNMHTTKPHQAYYEEILAKIACRPEDALMVGDSWDNDIAPAANLGLATYWLAIDQDSPPDPQLVTAYGSFEQLCHWLPTYTKAATN